MQALPDKAMIALAQQMADTAGDILRRAFRTKLAANRKADASPVTLADREVETALRALIESHYPEHGIIGEEYGNVRSESPFQWVLDPIDGTRSFIGGYALFTTLISLVHNGLPILGIIDQPILQERWMGINEQPTILHTENPLPIRGRVRVGADSLSPSQVSPPPNLPPNGGGTIDKTLPDAIIATTSIDYFTPSQSEAFHRLKKRCANTILGGDAYAYAMLASGHIDIVVDAGLKPYDFCALKPVIEGAGGIVTDWEGKPITLACDGRVIACANSALHQAVLSLLNQG